MSRLRPFLLASLLVIASRTASAQTRSLTGTILEEGSRTPIASVQVLVKGTNIGALTRDNGTFSLQVPTGPIALLIRRIGYPATEVAVAAGTSTVDVVLKRDVLKLDQIVVTGQATGISRRNLANSVASVSAEEVTKVSAPSIENAMQGKIPGAQISQSTGAPGGGNRVRIRGISSILGSAQPLYVIDGVIVTDVSIGTGTNKVTRAAGTTISSVTQEAPVNRIADLNPNDIENIDILKGSAAAAIYGSKASGGVIIITTKRGQVGKPRFSLRSGMGTARLAYKNGSRQFTTLADATAAVGAGAAQYFNTTTFIDYEDIVFGEHPVNSETALNVSGGTENTKYFVSALVRDEQGIVRNTFAKKDGLRVNVDQRLGERVNMQVGSELLRTNSDRGLFGNDNAGNSIAYTMTKIPSFLDLRRSADGSFPVNPFYPSNPFQTIDLFKNGELVWRNISTARLTMDAWSNASQKLQFIAYGGADILNQKNLVFSPPELQYERASTAGPGTTATSYTDNVQSNLNLNVVHNWTPRASLAITSQLGTQYERRSLGQTRASAQNLLGGLEVVTAGTVRDVDESRLRVEDFGVFGQTEVLWNDRLLLTLAARADRSSNNSDIAKFYIFPKAAASYRLPSLRPGLIDELKLRLAYGETGNLPLYGQKFTGLDLSSIGGLGAFRVGTTRAAADIRPERQSELEGGIDATILQSRATVELTAFSRNISDLLITRTLAPSSGFSAENSNGAKMKVWGYETSISAVPIQRERWSWNTRFNWGMNRSRITSLPVPAFLLGTPQVGAVKIEEGMSATQLIGNDTLPQPGGRVVVPVVMGDGNPLWNAGLSNEVRYGPLSVYALLDRQLGGMLANGTWRHYDLGQNSRDYDELTSDGKKLGEVRRTTYLQVTRIYYQDASYTKLREVTLNYDIPTRLVQKLSPSVGAAKLSLSGRNLKWWTNFRGGDPEAQNFGAGNVPDAVQRNREIGAYPASRSYWLTLSVDF